MTPILVHPLLFAVAAFGAGDDAGPLLDRIELAGGDLAKRDPLPSLVLEGTMSAEFADSTPIEEVHLGGDRALQRLTYEEFGTATMGRQGDVCFSSDVAVGIAVREGDEAASVQRMFAIFRRAPWRSIYGASELAGVEEVGGRKLTKVRMLPRETTADSSGLTGDTWWVDAAAERLVHVDLKIPDPQGGELPCRFTFADWREIDGVWFPATREQRVGTYVMKTHFTTIAPGAEVDEARVAPPADVAAAIADPARRATAARAAGEFTVEEVAERPVLSIRVEIPASEVSRNLAMLFPEVLGAVTRVGAEFAGPPFSRYHNFATAEGTLDLEAGIPVRAAVAVDDAGRVKASTTPGGRVATGWHVGPYQDLPETYEILQRWMAEQKLESAGGPWEVYWTDPGLEPDPAKWRTQVFWPVN